jgi:hypothetical protein
MCAWLRISITTAENWSRNKGRRSPDRKLLHKVGDIRNISANQKKIGNAGAKTKAQRQVSTE